MLAAAADPCARVAAVRQVQAPAKPAAPAKPGELWRAAKAGDVYLVNDLLARGADVDDADGDGLTALFWAAYGCHKETTWALHENGASIAKVLEAAAGQGGETEVLFEKLFEDERPFGKGPSDYGKIHRRQQFLAGKEQEDY